MTDKNPDGIVSGAENMKDFEGATEMRISSGETLPLRIPEKVIKQYVKKAMVESGAQKGREYNEYHLLLEGQNNGIKIDFVCSEVLAGSINKQLVLNDAPLDIWVLRDGEMLNTRYTVRTKSE